MHFIEYYDETRKKFVQYNSTPAYFQSIAAANRYIRTMGLRHKLARIRISFNSRQPKHTYTGTRFDGNWD